MKQKLILPVTTYQQYSSNLRLVHSFLINDFREQYLHQHGLIASGGGTADKMIRFWNALDGKSISKQDTGSQVRNLMFSKSENELISTHRYSQNQIVLWKSNEMKRITTLVGHSSRVLYLTMFPDGSSIVYRSWR